MSDPREGAWAEEVRSLVFDHMRKNGALAEESAKTASDVADIALRTLRGTDERDVTEPMRAALYRYLREQLNEHTDIEGPYPLGTIADLL